MNFFHFNNLYFFLIKKSFKLSPDIKINDDHGPGELDGWDSLGHVILINAIQKEYSILIDMDEMILDIGPVSIKELKEQIKSSKTVFWNGPPGVFEVSPFNKASIEIAEYIAELTQAGKIQSFAGGGDTVAAIEMAGVKDKFTYISTGGGALLELLEGKQLPGLASQNIL